MKNILLILLFLIPLILYPQNEDALNRLINSMINGNLYEYEIGYEEEASNFNILDFEGDEAPCKNIDNLYNDVNESNYVAKKSELDKLLHISDFNEKDILINDSTYWNNLLNKFIYRVQFQPNGKYYDRTQIPKINHDNIKDTLELKKYFNNVDSVSYFLPYYVQPINNEELDIHNLYYNKNLNDSSVLNKINKLENKERKIIHLIQFASWQYYKSTDNNKKDKLNKIIDRIINIIELDINDPALISTIYYQIAYLYFNIYEYPLAYKYYRMSLELNEVYNINSKNGILRMLSRTNGDNQILKLFDKIACNYSFEAEENLFELDVYKKYNDYLKIHNGLFNKEQKEYKSIDLILELIKDIDKSHSYKFILSPETYYLYNRMVYYYINTYYPDSKAKLNYLYYGLIHSLNVYDKHQMQYEMMNWLTNELARFKYYDKANSLSLGAFGLAFTFRNPIGVSTSLSSLISIDVATKDSVLLEQHTAIYDFIAKDTMFKFNNEFVARSNYYRSQEEFYMFIKDTARAQIANLQKQLNNKIDYGPLYSQFLEIDLGLLKQKELENKDKIYYEKELELSKSFTDSILKINRKLEATNNDLKKQIDETLKQTERADAKTREAENNLDTANMHKDTAEYRQTIIESQYKLLIQDTIDLNTANLKLLKKTNDAILYRNLAGCFGVAMLVFAIWQRKTNKKLIKEQTEKEELESQFFYGLLNIHNFKGLSTGDTILENYLEGYDNNIENLHRLKNLLDNTKSYARKLLENSKQKIITLNDEIESLKYYFETVKIEKDKKYSLITPTNDELYKYNKFVILANTLQPLIENSINYSQIGSLNEKGVIEIKVVEINKNEIELQVIDNGTGSIEKRIEEANFDKNSGVSLEVLEKNCMKIKNNGKQIMAFCKSDINISNEKTIVPIKIYM